MKAAATLRVAWALVPIFCAALLASPSVILPGDEPGIRRFRTPPLGPELRLGQTFTMTSDGFHAIDVLPVVVSAPVAGDIRFELYELVGDQLTLVRSAEVFAEDVVRARTYRFEFPVIRDSRDRTYRLDLVSAPADGVAFWATKGGRYEAGRMHANGRDRWADLAFRVHAPSPPIWAAFMSLRDTNPVRAYLAAAALIAIWLLVGFLVRALTAAPPAPDRAASSPAA